MIQGVAPGPRGTAPGVPGLTTGDALLSFGPDGAIVTFPDGLLGSDGWQTRWTGVIAELASRRRPRPLDALVIVLGADQLSGATKLRLRRAGRARRRAAPGDRDRATGRRLEPADPN